NEVYEKWWDKIWSSKLKSEMIHDFVNDIIIDVLKAAKHQQELAARPSDDADDAGGPRDAVAGDSALCGVPHAASDAGEQIPLPLGEGASSALADEAGEGVQDNFGRGSPDPAQPSTAGLNGSTFDLRPSTFDSPPTPSTPSLREDST